MSPVVSFLVCYCIKIWINYNFFFLQLDIYFCNGRTGQFFRPISYPQWRAAKYVFCQSKQWCRNRCRVRLKSRVLIHYQEIDLVFMAVALINKVTERILPLYAFCFVALQQTALHYVRLPKMPFLSLSRWLSTRAPRWSCGGVRWLRNFPMSSVERHVLWSGRFTP